MEERPVGERLRRHLAEPVVERREAAGQRGGDRHLPSRVARHDLRVLVEDGRPAHLGHERADVIGDEPVHGRRLTRIGWRVIRGHYVLGQHPPVGWRVDQPEQLGVDVLVLLPGVGRRDVHARRGPVRYQLRGCPGHRVRGPFRDRVGQAQSRHAREGRYLTRLVQAAEEVVERAVLEHDHDHVIDGVAPVRPRLGKTIRARQIPVRDWPTGPRSRRACAGVSPSSTSPGARLLAGHPRLARR